MSHLEQFCASLGMPLRYGPAATAYRQARHLDELHFAAGEHLALHDVGDHASPSDTAPRRLLVRTMKALSRARRCLYGVDLATVSDRRRALSKARPHRRQRSVYYHLLRQTWVLDQEKTQCSIARVALAVGVSDWKAREALRSLHAKGCIKIEDRSRTGHEIRVFLPSELKLPVEPEPPPDIGRIGPATKP
jgi:hypothetical protein